MITPSFKVSQTDEFVIIDVKISSIRFNAPGMEIVATDNVLVFHLAPYYLRLRFPHNLVDDERAKAEYKAADESIHIEIPKEEKGQYFEDLDFPSKLLAREGDIIGADKLTKLKDTKQAKGPLIQEVGSSNNINNEVKEIGLSGEQFNWEIEQSVSENLSSSLLHATYGFDNLYSSDILLSVANGNDINELDEPEKATAKERVEERLRKENLKFDPEYYVADLMLLKHGSEDDLELNGIKEIMNFTPNVIDQYLKWVKEIGNQDSSMPIEFTEKEQEQMQKNLPKKEYLVKDLKPLYVTILSVLFAYIFEQMENTGNHQTESAWTIGKLCPQISFLDQQLELNDEPQISIMNQNSSKNSIIRSCVISGVKRALSYPLHRNLELTLKVWKYVYYILRGGKRLVIRCLLDVHEIFRFHDVYYVYNKVLLNDLCSWFISNGNENVIRSLAVEVNNELGQVTPEQISFDCISDFNPETGEPLWENMTLKEMEILAEDEYRETAE
ncbi:hypothetical protein TPHA_0C03290 [Tetrapisispora phaffii CBS 4417]|uniref:CS domain-containing protein n=1 Tax=Tetrapisispora phaffii (strain ATCC 24235 / CBS 4417 / NBRC 1672 / NRRL Y-8282 / UCD 70-5) TaxID=1071381 RepID=G8BRV5_TETPH|nr:hypothetical protein TPHA_0C03290 [Tetrapisispora phaffii CBS 4417]CCE62481.1 hypothetical protein TPHA_0C03290 [Tetrapisispora phaffii CBS 4417]